MSEHAIDTDQTDGRVDPCPPRPRVPSLFDRHMDDVLAMAGDLLVRRGAFHVKLYFSSSQMSVWFYDNPYNYQVYLPEDVVASDLMDGVPESAFGGRVPKIDDDQVHAVLQVFKRMRLADDLRFLTLGSIHRLNGKIGLADSLDEASHMGHREFLRRYPGPG